MFQKRKPQQLWTDYLVERLHDEGYTQVKPFSECERVSWPDQTRDQDDIDDGVVIDASKNYITLETIIGNGAVQIILERTFSGADIGREGLRTSKKVYTVDDLINLLKNARDYDELSLDIRVNEGYDFDENIMIRFKHEHGNEEIVGFSSLISSHSTNEMFRDVVSGDEDRRIILNPELAPSILRPYLQKDDSGPFTGQRFANALVKYVKTTVKPVGESSSAREEHQELSRCYQRPENADYGAGVVHEEVAAQLEKNPREIRLRSFQGQNIYELHVLKNDHLPKIRGKGYKLRGVVDKTEVVERVRKLFQRIRPRLQDMRIIYQNDDQKYAIYTR